MLSGEAREIGGVGLVREPDAENLRVRFDERDVETEREFDSRMLPAIALAATV